MSVYFIEDIEGDLLNLAMVRRVVVQKYFPTTDIQDKKAFRLVAFIGDNSYILKNCESAEGAKYFLDGLKLDLHRMGYA